MDEPQGQNSSDQRANSDHSVLAPIGALHPQQELKSRTSNIPSDVDTDSTRDPRKRYWNQLLDEKPDRHIELVLSLAIAFFAATQLFTSCRNNDSTSQQTDQLISAAKISAYSATQNVQASRNFADSARSINQGIGEAVDKLGVQAGAANNMAETATIQAEVARQSAATSKKLLETERDLDRALVAVQDVAISQTPDMAYITFNFANSGRTVALHARYHIQGPSQFRINYENERFSGLKQTIRKDIPEPSTSKTIEDWTEVPDVGASSKTLPIELQKRRIAHDFLGLDYADYWTGRIEYEDIFGGKQWTTFCIEVYSNSISQVTYIPDFKVKYCPVGQDRGFYRKDE
jgi:hypothetical protein